MLSYELITQILRVCSLISISVFRFQWKTLELVRLRRLRRKTRPFVRCVAGVIVRTGSYCVMAAMLGKDNSALYLPCRLSLSRSGEQDSVVEYGPVNHRQ